MEFAKAQQIGNYTVVFPHKKGSYAETYRVKNAEGKTLFLKLINYAKIDRAQFDQEGRIIEIEVAKSLHHPNLCQYVDDGTFIHRGQRFAYVVWEFVSGETLSNRVVREQTLTVYDAKQVVKAVLSALQYLHSQPTPIVHNEVTLLNTMLDMTGQLSDARLIDFGHACYLNQLPQSPDLSELNPFYLAPERLKGVCCIQSDLFSVGVMLYQMVYGTLPWFTDLSGLSDEGKHQRIAEARRTPLKFPNVEIFEMDAQLLAVMAKAMAPAIEDRFQSASDFIKAIDGEMKIELIRHGSAEDGKQKQRKNQNVKHGNGFKDVAGMEALKKDLTETVLDTLRNPEKARKYKLDILNGMLLYGPPGCGKSFIAEKFAEESGYNYIYVKSSDLASIYVHGSQEKIGKLFDEARENAPTVLCFDEFDALVPNRSELHNQSHSGEVNEFLSQLNNCGKDGVFVIASTNKPDLIDPAVLRRGRIDKIVYVPVPDKTARAAMLQMHLRERPFDFGIDYDHLADLTPNYVASDLAYIANEAARRASMTNALITQDLLEQVIKENRPSLKPDVIAQYERMRNQFGKSEDSSSRRPIGFQ